MTVIFNEQACRVLNLICYSSQQRKHGQIKLGASLQFDIVEGAKKKIRFNLFKKNDTEFLLKTNTNVNLQLLEAKN